VVTAAGLLAQRFNSLNNVFAPSCSRCSQQRSAIVDDAKAHRHHRRAEHRIISAANATGSNPSALIDARDQAIDKLAGKMALEVSDQPDGTRNVALKTGQSLVLGGTAGR
jgi:flagellar hook-associated protein 1 FlgK